ncbi:hypothetical protein N0V82_003219 [Gnomoniopsis sp. IMI 355080]|nr:hypothetical protein N0V82_003219 [Gnomoniopsis sp. IMI 355080]
MIGLSTTTAGLLAVAVTVAVITRYVRLLWFHPLSKYPGPKLAACTHLWYAKVWTGGRWHKEISEAHQRYGNIIRIAPNELSFASVQAFKDIYGPPSKTRQLFTKSGYFYDTGIQSIVYEMDPQEHERQHRLFAASFRASAVRSQEHVVQEHIDAMIAQQRSQGRSGQVGLDLAAWMEWLAFDIIGELTFGEPFGAIRSGKAHYWVSLLHGAVYGASTALLEKRIAFVGLILRWAPALSQSAAESVKASQRHSALTLEKTLARIKMGNRDGIEDFLEPAIGELREGRMSEEQLAHQAYILMTAGAETSATAMAAAVWFLTQPENAECLEQVQREVRTTFATYDDMTGDAVSRLPYLDAVLEETMRIMPPVAMGPPRVSPGGTVDGVYVPKGVYVSADLWSISHDPRNAVEPDRFEPGRWLDGGRKPYSQPFIIGPRSCIGVNLAWLEMKLTLAKMVYSFDFRLAQETPGQDWVNECQLLLLWKKPKLMVKLVPV